MYIYIWIFSDGKKSSKQKCLVRVIEYAKQAVNFTTFKSWSRCMCLHLRKTTRTRVLTTVVTIGIRKTKKTKFCISLDGVAWLKLCCVAFFQGHFLDHFQGSFHFSDKPGGCPESFFKEKSMRKSMHRRTLLGKSVPNPHKSLPESWPKSWPKSRPKSQPKFQRVGPNLSLLD